MNTEPIDDNEILDQIENNRDILKNLETMANNGAKSYPFPDKHDRKQVLEIDIPLSCILAKPDHKRELLEFYRIAFIELENSGMIRAARDILNGRDR